MKSLFRAGMARNLALTFLSFGFLAASGIVINLFVVVARDSASLGVFNQAYSVYIVASQIAVFGLQYSTMRSAAFHENDRAELGRVLSGAAFPALLFGLAAAILVFLSEPLFAGLLGSPQAGAAVAIAGLGLVFFPLSKVLISFINGVQHMAAFAILQALRYSLVAGFAVGVAFSDLAFEYALYCFLVAELVTTVAAALYIVFGGLCDMRQFGLARVREHLAFGARSLAVGIFGEINTRIDVLMLGVFLDDRAVGIYSFAALFLDGVSHALAMVRVNFNPFLVGALRDNAIDRARALLRKTKVRAPAAMFGISVLALAAFLAFAHLILPEKDLAGGVTSLIILLTSITLVSGFMPFDNIMLASGRPGYQTFQQMAAVGANIAGNLALIPLFGIEGAALGTAFGFVAGTALQIALTYRFLGWNMLRS
ncbi:MAG: oligosaccharide flippase family protein [Phyllobacteriaceae bacterium]|nr:oligosaccharide flippase family protein [Phyllobacteriaceae bacterium]